MAPRFPTRRSTTLSSAQARTCRATCRTRRHGLRWKRPCCTHASLEGKLHPLTSSWQAASMGPARMPELGVASPGQNWTQHLRSPRRKHCLRPIQDQKHVRGVGNGRHLSHLQVRIQTQEEVDLNVGLVAGVVDGEAEQLVADALRNRGRGFSVPCGRGRRSECR